MTAPRVVVVGIGADGMTGLSPKAHAELAGATTIYGSTRQLDLLDDTITAARIPWSTPFLAALGNIKDSRSDVHVIASGDPMLHGVGASLIRLIGRDRVTVLPSVSSVTLACARLGWSVQDSEVISLVTGTPQIAVRRGGQAIVLSRDASSPAAVARVLTETGRGDSEFTVLEQLGGPAERVRTSTAQAWSADPADDVDALNVLAIRYLPDQRHLQTLPDDVFAHDGQLTKQPVRAVTLAALAPRPGELLWDVGSGSGSIAIEWCRSGKGCRAVAFERDEVRRARIVDNSIAFGVDLDVRGGAPEAFTDAVLSDGGVDGVPQPSAVFIGGGVTQPGVLQGCLDALPAGGRLVANAVTAESEAFLVQHYSRLGGQLTRYQNYRGEPVGTFTGWRPAMPVTQWSYEK
jgi:precorrin-6B C5,15-methyltransferase / cobalt-precorrin-6B C5,C15-methyltransferase